MPRNCLEKSFYFLIFLSMLSSSCTTNSGLTDASSFSPYIPEEDLYLRIGMSEIQARMRSRGIVEPAESGDVELDALIYQHHHNGSRPDPYSDSAVKEVVYFFLENRLLGYQYSSSFDQDSTWFDLKKAGFGELAAKPLRSKSLIIDSLGTPSGSGKSLNPKSLRFCSTNIRGSILDIVDPILHPSL